MRHLPYAGPEVDSVELRHTLALESFMLHRASQHRTPVSFLSAYQ
jgi:hypothetical protein